jgi:hypothetical protein
VPGTRHTAPEIVRRLRRAMVTDHEIPLEDDATSLLIECNRGGQLALPPPTVADAE